MKTEQITLRELLRDPVYKAWFLKKPKLKTASQRWRVWVKLPGKGWAHRDFPTFNEAMKWFVPRFKQMEDAAVACLSVESKPPVVRTGFKTVVIKKVNPRTAEVTRVKQKVPIRQLWSNLPGRVPAEHRWCGYCRRPTVFGWYKHHHALPLVFASYERRCRVCGVKQKFLGRWSQ